MGFTVRRMIGATCETEGCHEIILQTQRGRIPAEHLRGEGWHVFGGRCYCSHCKEEGRIPEKHRNSNT